MKSSPVNARSISRAADEELFERCGLMLMPWRIDVQLLYFRLRVCVPADLLHLDLFGSTWAVLVALVRPGWRGKRGTASGWRRGMIRVSILVSTGVYRQASSSCTLHGSLLRSVDSWR